MNQSRHLSRDQGSSAGYKLVAIMVVMAVTVILIAPQVDLDDTTLQTSGLMPVIVIKVVTRTEPVLEPHARVAQSQTVNCAPALTDLNCARLI